MYPLTAVLGWLLFRGSSPGPMFFKVTMAGHHESKHKKNLARKIVPDYTERATAECCGGWSGLPQIFCTLDKAGISSTIQVPWT